MPQSKREPRKRTAAKPNPKASSARTSLAEAMSALEKAGSAQTRKTYARHGAEDPMFGVSFATFKTLVKRIGVDHNLARALWDTGNFDARILAVKVADPSSATSDDLDRWARSARTRMLTTYVGQLAGESPHAAAKARRWLASEDARERAAGWAILGSMAMREETIPDPWFAEQLVAIQASIHSAPNADREAMNMAVITIGCRNSALRKAAIAAAKRIGKVDVDHGDTACKTPDAASYIEKTWAHSTSKGFTSPAAHERTRETPRRRC